ncbi:hypothetical protein W97_01583 [Coniosporium apollinis CBS 100218]|uniref:Xylanolytic transcriptional activator regulatory domain-containing protein n=1 Tax=Coniosporium apollinis (strain CBS 100218) TaxID=1168221 RepID=R7YL30_CONA1|nr:uncharacterized protein W97_01583 [Coniosporium apollinis CBS 100218]EON62361.1 hypothetical protein W97_01583 [Coniosporium apollinis CBS 100218]
MNGSIPGVKALVLVMQFIGSLYAPTVSTAPLEEQVEIALAEQQPFTCGFEVQALVLYSIAVYWYDNIQRAREILDMATSKALALGMNSGQFAAGNSQGDPVLAESWRRTWWQLYLADAHIASSNHATTFGTSQRNVLATVELPCEEANYNSGNIPHPKTLEDYDNREFALDDDTDFSSFAYLIGLARSLDHTIIGIPRNSEENVHAICTNADASVAAWLSLLSKSKRKFFRDDRTLDELLFKANMLIQVYTVDIHRSLSTLAYSAIEAVSSCAPPPPPERLAPVYYSDAHIHTTKILRAIERMTDMLTLPTRIAVHSPFTICMIATMTIAHLSACKYVLKGEQLKIARERIRVAMGALEVFAEVWPRGKKVVREVKIVARELLSLGAGTEAREPTEVRSLLDANALLILDDSLTIDADSFARADLTGYFGFPSSDWELELGLASSDVSLRTGFPFEVTGV